MAKESAKFKSMNANHKQAALTHPIPDEVELDNCAEMECDKPTSFKEYNEVEITSEQSESPTEIHTEPTTDLKIQSDVCTFINWIKTVPNVSEENHHLHSKLIRLYPNLVSNCKIKQGCKEIKEGCVKPAKRHKRCKSKSKQAIKLKPKFRALSSLVRHGINKPSIKTKPIQEIKPVPTTTITIKEVVKESEPSRISVTPKNTISIPNVVNPASTLPYNIVPINYPAGNNLQFMPANPMPINRMQFIQPVRPANQCDMPCQFNLLEILKRKEYQQEEYKRKTEMQLRELKEMINLLIKQKSINQPLNRINMPIRQLKNNKCNKNITKCNLENESETDEDEILDLFKEIAEDDRKSSLIGGEKQSSLFGWDIFGKSNKQNKTNESNESNSQNNKSLDEMLEELDKYLENNQKNDEEIKKIRKLIQKTKEENNESKQNEESRKYVKEQPKENKQNEESRKYVKDKADSEQNKTNTGNKPAHSTSIMQILEIQDTPEKHTAQTSELKNKTSKSTTSMVTSSAGQIIITTTRTITDCVSKSNNPSKENKEESENKSTNKTKVRNKITSAEIRLEDMTSGGKRYIDIALPIDEFDNMINKLRE